MDEHVVVCDHSECVKTGSTIEMHHLGDGWYVCNDCLDLMEDTTGYCGVKCKLGYGCDHSC